MIDVGEDVVRRTEFKVPDLVTGVQTLTNATTMTYEVTAVADGTVITPTVDNPSAGVYTATVPTAPTGAGDYLELWTATYAGASYVTHDQFHVAPPGLRLLSLAEAKDHLNKSGAVTTDDEELRSMIDSITAVIEHHVGPVVARDYVDTVTVYGDVMILPNAPVISLTSIAAPQAPSTAPLLADLWLDPPSGLVRYTAGGYLPSGLMTVYYQAGRKPIPDAIRTAAKIILAHVWETQRGGSAGPRIGGAEPDSDAQFGQAFTVPNRAMEFLAPYLRAPAVA